MCVCVSYMFNCFFFCYFGIFLVYLENLKDLGYVEPLAYDHVFETSSFVVLRKLMTNVKDILK